MVALKTYTPKSLGFTPYQIATQLAEPYDYSGTVKAIQEWNNLANNEAVADINAAKAEEAKRQAEFDKKREEILKSKVDAGESIDLAEVEKTLGNVEGYLKIRQDQQKQSEEKNSRTLSDAAKIASIYKTQPEVAAMLGQQAGLASITGALKAPPQKEDKPDKPKPSKPQTWINMNDGKPTIVDANSVSETAEAKARGFIPQDVYESGVNSGLFKPKSAETPEAGPGLLERMFNSATGQATPAATPGPAAISKPPPGHLLVRDKATGEIKIVKK